MRRNPALSYLRAFITVLVLAHHAVLAYHPFAPMPPRSLMAQPRMWGAFPVVDVQRWSPFSLLVSFNDTFFMALMFFLSGLFVWQSLQRKGSGSFLRDRVLRLGVPFLVAVILLAPLAYYPSYLQTGATAGIAGFWQQWHSLGAWPVGPAWFLWLLLAFDAVAALSMALVPRWFEGLQSKVFKASPRPFVFFSGLVLASAVAYIPMEFAFGAIQWTGFGPFFFQTSRMLHYGVYFLAGIAVGSHGVQRGLLAAGGTIARQWIRWSVASLVSFVATVALFIATLSIHTAPRLWESFGDLAFVVCCAATCCAFLALFTRFAAKQSAVFDSLSANAYGMYLIHYAIVSWLQYELLGAHLSAWTKGLIVFLGTVALSWTITSIVRRIPSVARVV